MGISCNRLHFYFFLYIRLRFYFNCCMKKNANHILFATCATLSNTRIADKANFRATSLSIFRIAFIVTSSPAPFKLSMHNF